MSIYQPRIAIFEIDPVERAHLTQMLFATQLGLQSCEVIEMTTLDIFEDELARQRYDLILSGLAGTMDDDVSALSALAVSIRHRSGPLVYISHRSHLVYAHRVIALGAFDYLEKPVAEERFADVVRRALAGGEGEQDIELVST